jgi:hypothetical protein
VTAAKRAVDPDHRSGPETAPRDLRPDPDRHQAGRAADHRPNPKAEAAVERLKELIDAKNQIRDETRGETADEAAEPAADRRPDHFRDEKGLFVQGNPGGPGRPRGSKNILPRGSRKMMKKLIAGRLTQDGRPIATIMVDLFFQGLQGGVVLRRNAKTTTYVSPAAFLKLFLDYMLKIREQALKAKAAKINSKGSSGGIRVVLLNPHRHQLPSRQPAASPPKRGGKVASG